MARDGTEQTIEPTESDEEVDDQSSERVDQSDGQQNWERSSDGDEQEAVDGTDDGVERTGSERESTPRSVRDRILRRFGRSRPEASDRSSSVVDEDTDDSEDTGRPWYSAVGVALGCTMLLLLGLGSIGALVGYLAPAVGITFFAVLAVSSPVLCSVLAGALATSPLGERAVAGAIPTWLFALTLYTVGSFVSTGPGGGGPPIAGYAIVVTIVCAAAVVGGIVGVIGGAVADRLPISGASLVPLE